MTERLTHDRIRMPRHGRLVPLSDSHPRQSDRTAYTYLSSEGVREYARLYGGEGEQGIPVDDLNAFASLVYTLKDNKERFRKLRTNGQRVRHVDVGTGPNVHMVLASVPYVDEIVTIDRSPANVDFILDIVKGIESYPPHLDAWGEIAAILYDIGDVKKLRSFSQRNIKLFDKLRDWCRLDDDAKQEARNQIYEKITKSEDNPYRSKDFDKSFRRALKPRIGDILDDVGILDDLVGTAEITTMTYVAESISTDPIIVAHGIRNAVQFGQEGSLWQSVHMLLTDAGYAGFFTSAELEKDARVLEELPATAEFFKAIVGACVQLDSTDKSLSTDSKTPEHQKMVRSKPYEGVAILSGIIDNRQQPQNGKDLLRNIGDQIRVVVVESLDSYSSEVRERGRRYCGLDECWYVEKELRYAFEQENIHLLSGPEEVIKS